MGVESLDPRRGVEREIRLTRELEEPQDRGFDLWETVGGVFSGALQGVGEFGINTAESSLEGFGDPNALGGERSEYDIQSDIDAGLDRRVDPLIWREPRELLNRYLRPDPRTSSDAALFVHDLSRVLVPILLTRGASATNYGRTTTAELVEQGVDPRTARVAGNIDTLAMTAGMVAPAALGFRSMLARAASGAAINVPFGMGQRAAVGEWLRSQGYEDVAANYNWLDPAGITIDAVLGLAFGAISPARSTGPRDDGGSAPPPPIHTGPSPLERFTTPDAWLDEAKALATDEDFTEAYAHALIAREQGATDADAVLAMIAENAGEGIVAAGEARAGEIIGEALTHPDSVAAALTVAREIHDTVSSAPGIPADGEARRAHARASDTAMRQVMNDEPVDVSGTGVEDARFIPHPRDENMTLAMETFARTLEEQGYGDMAADLRAARDAGTPIGDDPGLMFSRGGGRSSNAPPEAIAAALQSSFGKDAQRLLETGKTEIVGSVGDLARVTGRPIPADVKGVYDPKTGKTYLVAENVSREEAARVLLHEVGVHAGMREFLGAKGYADLGRKLDELIDSGNPIAKAARERVDALVESGAMKKEHANEEALAYLVEQAPDLPFVKRILAHIRMWIWRTFGDTPFARSLSVEDIRALAVGSLRRQARLAERAADADRLRTASALTDPNYETGSIIARETAEWRLAEAKGLDLSLEARKARAEAQGFDFGTVYFHGTANAPFTAFQASSHGTLGPGVYLALDHSKGDYWADRSVTGRPGYAQNRRVLPLVVRGEFAPEKAFNDLRQQFKDNGLPEREAQTRANVTLQTQGFAGVKSHSQGGMIAVFDPTNIRSIHAAFDPDYRDSANLLASRSWDDLEKMMGDSRSSGRGIKNMRSREDAPPNAPEYGSEEWRSLAFEARSKKDKGQRLSPLEDWVLRNDEGEALFSRDPDPVKQAIIDEPDLEIPARNGESVRAADALEDAKADEADARDMSKGFDAAASCAVQHGFAPAARGASRATRDLMAGQGLGLLAAAPAAYGLSMGLTQENRRGQVDDLESVNDPLAPVGGIERNDEMFPVVESAGDVSGDWAVLADASDGAPVKENPGYDVNPATGRKLNPPASIGGPEDE